MRVAVFGSGAVGGYFGARLAEAGEPVAFIARGAHLEAIRRDGLRIESVAGDVRIHPATASDDPRTLGAVDVVLVGVKAWQVPEVAARMEPLLHADTFVVPLQNGVETADRLAEAVGARRVLGGLCRISSYLAAPGLIRHVAIEPRVEFGERDGRPSERVAALRAAFERAKGVAVSTPSDIEAAAWDKLLFIAPVSGVGAATRLPLGAVREVPETRKMLDAAIREVFDLARAKGVALPEESLHRVLKAIDRLPADSTSSLQRDFLEGRPSELDDQIGAVVRLARAAGMPVPVHELLYATLLPAERKARAAAAAPVPAKG